MGMGIRVSLLVGLAVSALFYGIQRFFDLLAAPWSWIVPAGAGIVVLLAAILMNRNAATSQKSRTSLMTDIDGERDVRATIDGLKTGEAPSEIMTRIKAKDNINLEVKNTEFDVKGR